MLSTLRSLGFRVEDFGTPVKSLADIRPSCSIRSMLLDTMALLHIGMHRHKEEAVRVLFAAPTGTVCTELEKVVEMITSEQSVSTKVRTACMGTV